MNLSVPNVQIRSTSLLTFDINNVREDQLLNSFCKKVTEHSEVVEGTTSRETLMKLGAILSIEKKYFSIIEATSRDHTE